MCGIQLEVSVCDINSSNSSEDDHQQDGAQRQTENLSRRGPDHLGSVSAEYPNHHRVELQASVLKMRSHSMWQPVSLQGNVPIPAAQVDNAGLLLITGDIGTMSTHFCWNGEVYQRYNEEEENSIETVAGYEVADTQLVADMLQLSRNKVMTALEEDSVTTTSQEAFLEGYATGLAEVFGRLVNAEYAFCIVTPWSIYYGRDPQGRRSLLYWDDNEAMTENHNDEETDNEEGQNIPTSGPHSWKLVSVTEQYSKTGSAEHQAAIQKTWKEVVPGMVHEYRFHTGQTHSTAIIRPRIPSQQITLPAPTSIPDNVTLSMWQVSLALEHYLRQAVQLRVCGGTSPNVADCHSAPSQNIAVLFSGGIDSVVLAALTLQVLPPDEPLRLWNVSFVDEHAPEGAAPNPTKSQDCRAAQASYEELLQLFPHRKILLETTEVSWDEMTRWEAHIRTLLHPKSTTMDLNIAMALWFASRGRAMPQVESPSEAGGKNGKAQEEQDLLAEPRILIVGMGADEQLGGYGRHRKAFERGSKDGGISSGNARLREELDLDIERLWERNLGRDDRIFSDHGKEARFPYLDYHVMTMLASTPLDDVCDFCLPPGQGDKRILRLMAMRLGLTTASGMVKRAIQFGSRISHVSDKRRFGSRRKAKGNAVV